MPGHRLAHIARDVSEHLGASQVLVGLALFVFGAVTLRHLRVGHGSLRAVALGRAVMVAAALSVVAFIMVPQSTNAQDLLPAPGLPDLISDRPVIWFEKVIESNDGSLSRVLAFDGYLHNVGEGSLDLLGNPQIAGGVKQRVFDGQAWEAVSSPTVRYETTDGHNHFHLIGAVDYSLWGETRREKIGESSKVGFCLVDTEQVASESADGGNERFYGLRRFNYCNEDDPDATELRMGISPGWRDTYDANTTLQWVDVSDVQPGRYWVGAVTDPRDEIVESNEENNALVYSMNTFQVSGYRPFAVPAIEVRGDTTIALPSIATATVGPRSWTITNGPAHGLLDVPIGSAFHRDEITYRPDPDFTGVDSLSYVVRDASQIFPLRPLVQTISLSVEALASDSNEADADAENGAPVIDETVRAVATSEFEWTEASFAASDPDGDRIRWFARNLPAGLRLDERTGVVSGVPTARGFYPSEVIAFDGAVGTSTAVDWTVAAVATGRSLLPSNERHSAIGDRVWMTLGRRAPGSNYVAEGLPDGLAITYNTPRISGSPTTVGDFEVTVREIIDDAEIQSVTFDWTIRPRAIPAFPL